MARGALASPKKKAAAEGRTVVFVDESGFYPLPAVTRTYAPSGETPVLKNWLTYSHLSAISAVTPDGELYFSVQDHSIKCVDVVRFVKHLTRQIPGKLLVVWDGAPIHRGRELREFLANGAAERVELERLPGYAPELNPDEAVWKHLKFVELRNLCCQTIEQLFDELRKAVKRLRSKPHLIEAFVAGVGLD